MVSDSRERASVEDFSETRAEENILNKETGSKWIMGKLHNEELHTLYCLPNIFRTITIRKIRCTGHVIRMEK
jgi:hypothetical protein